MDAVNYLVFDINHSQSLNEKPLWPWGIVQADGQVISAHCTCMAGLAECCSHVGALLFTVEAIVRIRESKTVTDEKNYWLLPSSKRNIEYSEITNIDFTSSKSKKKMLDSKINSISSAEELVTPSVMLIRKSMADVSVPTQEQISKLYASASKCGYKPVVLAHISPYSDDYIPAAANLEKFPPLLSDLYYVSTDKMN